MNPLIPALSAAYGLFSGAGQQREARNQQRRALQAEAEARRLAMEDFARTQEEIRQARAAGVGDPREAIKAIDALYAKASGLATTNAARAFRTAGGRAGDTSLIDAINAYNQRATPQYTAQVLDAKRAALNESLRLSELLSRSSAMAANATRATAQGLRYDAAANPGDVASPIQALGNIDWDGIFGRRRNPNQRLARNVAAGFGLF